MGRLNRYLATLFLQRLAVTAFGMVTLLGVLDALGSADILPPDAGFGGNLRYMILRLPILFDRILPFAVLLAILLTYGALIRRNELVAILATGLSVFGQMRALLPAVAVSLILCAVLIDRVSPVATRALEDWLGADVLREDSREPKALWLAEDRLLVEIKTAQGASLRGLTLLERAKGGRILSVSRARSAEAGPEGWQLSGVEQIRFDGKPLSLPTVWATAQTPETLRLLLSEPRDLSVSSLLALSQMTGTGNRPSSAYVVWLMNRLLLPFVGIGLLMLAVPIMQRYARRDNGFLAMGAATGVGFVYMLTDGIFKTFAESGSISVAVAVLAPIGVLMLAGVVLTLRRAGPG